MNYKQSEEKKKQGALVPLLGFIVMLVSGGVGFLAAPSIRSFLENTTWNFGAFGWRILPLNFPSTWSDLAVRGVITVVVFLIIFSLYIIVSLALTSGPEDESLQYVRERQDELRRKRRK